FIGRRRVILNLRGRKHDVNPFDVAENEQLVMEDRPTDTASVLINVGKRPNGGSSRTSVNEPVYGVHYSPVPGLKSVSVPVVGAGLGDVVHLRRTRPALVHREGESVDAHLLYGIQSELKVGGAGIVQIQEWVVGVHAV